MKFNPVFQHYIDCSNTSEIFQYLQDTLTDSIIESYSHFSPKLIKISVECIVEVLLLSSNRGAET